MDHQAKMGAAFNNYLVVSDLLMSDGEMLMECKQDDDRWKRNFIRTASALVEGCSYCFWEMARIGLDWASSEVPTKERDVLLTDVHMSTDERLKLILRASYRIFELSPIPDFGTEDWVNARLALQKRNALMHPRVAADLELSLGSWSRIYAGLSWVIEQHFDFIRLIHERYIKNSG